MSTQSERSPDSLGPLIFLILIFVGLWIGFALTVWKTFPTFAERGQFGDMFGAINALFSGLALAGVVYTVFLQRKELALQRVELQLTREELRRAADAHENSQRFLGRQADEMGLAAELSAISNLVETYDFEIRTVSSTLSDEARELKRKREVLIKRLEQIYDEMLTERKLPGPRSAP